MLEYALNKECDGYVIFLLLRRMKRSQGVLQQLILGRPQIDDGEQLWGRYGGLTLVASDQQTAHRASQGHEGERGLRT